MLTLARIIAPALFIFIALLPRAQAQDDKVFRTLTPEATGKILEDFKVEFQKSVSKKGDEHYFEFTRNNYKIRLTLLSADEMLLDCVFRGAPIEKVNQWNTFTRVTRASYHKTSSGDITMLEYGLDLSGGVTAGTVKQFIVRYDEELKKFDKYLGNANDDVILAEVTDEKLENLLKTMAINYQKKANSAGVMMYDFELGGHKLRMYNFGGKDLMIDAHFKKISLDDANRYNLNRKFVRVVNYRGKDVEYTALECNLDCEAGVTEGILRNWITSFGSDARHFSEYAKKLEPSKK
jgi:hypothetical protein